MADQSNNATIRLNKVRVRDLQLAIRASVAVDVPLLALGGYGGGKSKIIRGTLEDMGYAVLDGVRVSQLEPTDLGGIPAINLSERTAERLMPDLINSAWRLHRETGKLIAMFLDELPSAPPGTQAALYQIVLERRAAGFVLPPGTRIIAAGNRPEDKGVTYDMPLPMCNRFMIVEFGGPTREEFMSYMVNPVGLDIADDQVVRHLDSTGVSPEWEPPRTFHPLVMAFLDQHAEWITGKADADAHQGRNPTPRSWEVASWLLYYCDEARVSDTDRKTLLSSAVGDPAALAMEATIRLAKDIVPFEDIVADPDKAPVSPNKVANLLQVLMMVGRLDKRKPSEFEAVVKYVERMSGEMMAMFLRRVLATNTDLIVGHRKLIAKYAKYCTAGLRMRS